jgi:hypothetical protein
MLVEFPASMEDCRTAQQLVMTCGSMLAKLLRYLAGGVGLPAQFYTCCSQAGAAGCTCQVVAGHAALEALMWCL